jgi:hypothetical protein
LVVDPDHRDPAVTKGISVDLKAHLAQPYHRLATCWRVTLTDGTVKAFTDHDRDIVFAEGSPAVVTTYLASSGYTATNVVSSDALDVDNLDVAGMLVSPSMTEEALRTGTWDGAAVEIFVVNWTDLEQGRLIQRCGTIGEVTENGTSFNAELRGLLQAYARTIGELTSPQCRATFGDSRCTVDLYPLTVTGTIDSVHDDQITLYDSARTEPGPEGGYTVDSILLTSSVARITIDTPSGPGSLHNGMTVMISGIQGPAALNVISVIRNLNGGTPFTNIDIAVDASSMPAYVSGGLVTPLGNESGYFDFGLLTMTSGANAGISREVKQYTPGQITLAMPFPYAVVAGDSYSLVPGCDKQLVTCRDTYDNVVNFRGEPYLPGVDRIVQVGRSG